MTNLAFKTASNYSTSAIHIRLIDCEFAYNKCGEKGKMVHYELSVECKEGEKLFDVQEIFVPLADQAHSKNIEGLDLLNAVETINKKHQLWDSASEILDYCFASVEPVDIIKSIKNMRNNQIGLPDLLTLKVDFDDVCLDSVFQLRDRVDFQVSVNIFGKDV